MRMLTSQSGRESDSKTGSVRKHCSLTPLLLSAGYSEVHVNDEGSSA